MRHTIECVHVCMACERCAKGTLATKLIDASVLAFMHGCHMRSKLRGYARGPGHVSTAVVRYVCDVPLGRRG